MNAKISEYIRSCLIMLFCVGYCLPLAAQHKYLLKISPVDQPASVIDSLRIQTSFPTKFECLQYLHQLPVMLASRGYISASVDSVKEDSAEVGIRLFIGQRYLWKRLQADDESWQILNRDGFRKVSFNQQPFDPDKVNAVYQDLLNYYAVNGYPFAKIDLDSLQLSDTGISAKLEVVKGYPYYIDSIHLEGNVKISQDFIHRYLGIPDHDPYNQDKLDKIDQQLAALPYIEQTHPWDLTMLGSGAILNLYLQERKSNEINVLVGFLPANPELGGKLLVTGNADLNLKNAFGEGETIGLNWLQVQPRSPQLNLLFQRPYLFHSPFGVEMDFGLVKQDSFYLNVNAQLGLQYVLSPRQSGKVILGSVSTTVLSTDTLQVIQSRQLPAIIDMQSVSLGMEYDYNSTDYQFNPRSGNILTLLATAGNKHIKKDNQILQIKDTSFNYAGLYDTIRLQSYQVSARIKAAHFFPLGKVSTLETMLNAGLYQSPSYFDNELFRIGGYKLLRGFDEASIYTDRFLVGTLEYRYLLGQNSYFSAFTDYGLAHYQRNSLSFSHSYLGIGIGLAFETKSGIFNISYAAGKRNDQSLDLRQSKIHLGFVTVF